MDFSETRYERRQFFRRVALAGAGWMLAGSGLRAVETLAAADGRVPRRKFGRHDFTVSALAVGGHALRLASDDEARRMIDAAEELGIDFLDNSWDYHKGASEELMGKLIAGRRDRFFLMTKVCTHDTGGSADAMRMLEESLKRLGTDHLDLWQWHAVATPEQVKRGFAEDGVVHALTKAREQGKVRFVGFTGHTEPDVHLAVLAEKYPFDACQIPISPIEANSNAFVRRVLPEILKQRIAPLAMKTLGGDGRPLKDGVITLPEALDYAWSLPISSLVTGAKSAAELRENAALASAFRAMTPEQLAALEERLRPATEANEYQPYRKWMSYRDGDAATGRFV